MAISGRHCRSERAIVKTVRTPDLSLRGGRRPTWQSREGTAVRNGPPLNRHAPPICHCEERSDVAISGRHCRSERAIVKTVRTSDLSLRGAKRRGNLGKALPFGTSHRKNGTHLRFVIARRPEADVAISQYSLG